LDWPPERGGRWSIAMRNSRVDVRPFMVLVPTMAALVLASVLGASSPADARFMMPMAHMPLTHGPFAHGPLDHGPNLHPRVWGRNGGRDVRIPQHHPRLAGHQIGIVTSDCGGGARHRYLRCGGTRLHSGVGTAGLPVSTDVGVQVVQGQRGGGGGNNNVVPRGERRFVPDEVLTEFNADASPQAIAQVARRFNLTQLESQRFDLIGSTFYRWRIGGRRTVPALVNALGNQSIVAAVQPNYLFALEEETTPAGAIAHGDPAQYVLGKLEVGQAHQIATGKNVLLAVIDSAIDGGHPDLGGSIVKNFDALGGKADPQLHGTEMAGAIATHGKLLGIAPGVELLAARAFDNTPGKARGTSFDVLKSLQWAADNDARVINMSFAGPADPTLHRMLTAAYQKNIVLIAAAGNNGPYAAPAYPAADPDVIAVTATDADDKPFKMANRGTYVAVAAPGVEIVALAPDASYQITTGTSVAAAHVSGIAALLLQRDPSLKPADIRAILTATAKPLRATGHDAETGAGLVDAFRAIMAPQIKAAGAGEVHEQAAR
jgi:subtilisin family serine protease